MSVVPPPPFSHALSGDVARVEAALGGSDAPPNDVDGCPLLHYAAFGGHEAVVAFLLKLKCPVDVRDMDEMTALHVASFKGHANIVAQLLDAGADGMARDCWAATPLHKAALCGHGAVVELLIARCAPSLTAQDVTGCVPIHLAASAGHTSIVQQLARARPELDIRDWSELRPVHYAAYHGRLDTLQALHAAGADLSLLDRQGWTVLHHATCSGNKALVEWLLALPAAATVAGGGSTLAASPPSSAPSVVLVSASQDDTAPALLAAGAAAPLSTTSAPALGPMYDVDAQDKRGVTCLHLACQYGHAALVELLAARDAKLNARDKKGCVGLHFAASYKQTECVRVLLELGQAIDAADLTKATPLHKACSVSASETAAFLLAHGAKVDSVDEEGAQPIHKAAFAGCARSVQLLLEKGASVSVTDGSDATPLHKAMFSGQEQAASVLLKRGADPTARDAHGGQPLHSAAAQGHVACVKLLLEHKSAQASATDERGNSVVHWAAAAGSKECIELLKLYGADVNALNTFSSSPLFWALRKGHPPAATLLILLGATLSDQDKERIVVRDLRRLYGIVKPDILLQLVKKSDGSAPAELHDLVSGRITPGVRGAAPRQNKKPNSARLVQSTSSAAIGAGASLPESLAKGIELFNSKPVAGITQLQKEGHVGPTTTDVAKFLYSRPELNKKKIGEYVGENEDFPQLVLTAFISLFDFTALDFDIALRRLLFRFRLPGEAQKIDRVMQRFAKQYYADNPKFLFVSADAVYVLAFACIMLNTDAHNPAIAKKNKMTKDQFLTHVRGINGGKDLPPEYLEDLYNRIQEDEIRMDDSVAYPDAVKKGYVMLIMNRASAKRRYTILTDTRLLFFRKPADSEPLLTISVDPARSPVIAKDTSRSAQFAVKIDIPAHDKEPAAAIKLQCHNELEAVSWLANLQRVQRPAKP